MVPDTGATRTVIASDVAAKFGIPVKRGRHERRYTANNGEMNVSGSTVLKAEAGGVKTYIDAIVSEDLKNEILMSWHDLINLGVLPRDFPNHTFLCSVTEGDSLDKLKEDFPDVLSDILSAQPMKGPPMKIHLRNDIPVVPLHVCTTRQIPLHQQKEAEDLVSKLVEGGIISPVNHPTDWISHASFVAKENGKAGVRLITDFRVLNQFVKRPVHPFMSANDIIQRILPESKVFAKLDAVQGYFQIKLDEESSDLTTFLLPSGRYKYNRTPMGLNASGDEWNQRSDAVITGLVWAAKIIDDILIQAPNLKVLFERIRIVLRKCREQNITISKRKLSVGPQINFAGYIISDKGVQPDPEKTTALSEFPRPDNVTNLRSFLGLANQLGSFVPDLAQMTADLRKLLKKNVAYVWLEPQENSFQNVKKLLASNLLVKPFDPKLHTELLTDASRLHGLGYMLMQKDDKGKPHIIKCGSCSLTSAQSNYATIELECLAILRGIEKCDYFLKGISTFTVITDHRPLLGTFAKPLHELSNPRLLRFREKLTSFSFNLVWHAGKDHLIADALSRSPVFKGEEEEEEKEEENRVSAVFAREQNSSLSLLFKNIDSNYTAIVEYFKSGEPFQKLALSHPARSYRQVWSQLSSLTEEGKTLLIYDGSRIIVPKPARKEILRLLHLPHQGQVKTKKAAQLLYYWPGMNSDIANLVNSCEACQRLRPSIPNEPLVLSSSDFPMQQVGVDLFHFASNEYLAMVDRYSGFLFCEKLSSTATTDIVKILNNWFLDFGFPNVIRSDNGPQFRTNFKLFCDKNNIVHETSSPYNAQSNGLAESGVKSLKHLLLKCEEKGENFKLALSELRAMPRADGFSPSQMFFKRAVRGSLPNLQGHPNFALAEESRVAEREKSNLKAPVQSQIEVGQKVFVQHPISKLWDQEGIIISMHENGRSYEIQISDKVYRRNRRFIRPFPKVSNDLETLDIVEKAELTFDELSQADLSVAPRRSARLASKLDKSN